MSIKRSRFRKIEIITGFFLTLSIISFLLAFLLSFNFSTPHGNIGDDIDFMLDSLGRLKISAILWLITGSVNLIYLPVYLVFFQRFQKGIHIFNGAMILYVAFAFFIIGINELEIIKIAQDKNDLLAAPDDEIINTILTIVKQIKFLLMSGITAFGAYATVLCVSGYGELKLPFFGQSVTFLAGPVVIAFTWINMGHILMTTALAILWTGLLIIGVRLINWGLKKEKQNPENQGFTPSSRP
ncbi:MAG: hypothetical protein K9J30_07465 [Bacteroidales bacterium]|nr:hypothetical protein [Bacteroidales bacterium]